VKQEDARLARALEWIARLPLGGEPELAGLLGLDQGDARQLAHELARHGWVESIEPGSPELELRRLLFVREEAVPALAHALGLAPRDVMRALPVRLKDTLDRVARVEITAGVSRFFGDLASDLRLSGVTRLADARSLPLALPAAERWWLPRAEGYGCLRAGTLWAPFLVAWDRAASPDLHRRRRVAAWPAAAAAVARHWGADGLPPILVVSPSEQALLVWERALVGREDDGAAGRLDVLLTTREELRARGPGGAVWRAPGCDGGALLVEQLGWGGAPPVTPLFLPEAIDAPPPPPRTAPSLREWAAARATANVSGPIWQRVAVLALATGASDKPLIEWVARHPLLSAAELAALLSESEELVERRLEWLARCGAVRVESATSAGESTDGEAPAHHYVLTELGMRLLAARAGTPPDIFARHGGVTVADAGTSDEPACAIRHRAHTLGVNRFFARLAADARRAGWRLAEWRNEAESTRRFRQGDRTSWIRPDGSGVLVRDGESRPFLLEYDRGTLDAGDYRGKFEGYRRYFAGREWENHFVTEPVLLFACIDDRAERQVARAASGSPTDLPALVTTEWRFEQRGRSVAGLFGRIWRGARGTRSVRSCWPPE
jgi:hypothetical protein